MTVFLLYILVSLALLLFSLLALYQRPGRNQNVNTKNNFLNTLTLLHVTAYCIITIYSLVSFKFPLFAFKGYLFIDPLAAFEVVIALVVFLVAAIYGRGYIKSLLNRGEIKAELLELFYGSFNLLLTVMIFSFFSNNLALFWILLELSTILSAVLIVILSARENIIAALKYVFIASTAMLFSVIGLIILFAMTQQITGVGTLNWSELMQIAGSLPPSLYTFAFTFIFVGFAAKAGIAPFHTWLPQAHAKAPAMISAVLSAVLLNGGTYGILRLCAVTHLNASWSRISLILIIFGSISIAVAAFSMLTRSNLKKLIGFSSIEHMGLVLIGFGIGTSAALFWTLFHTLAHSLVKSLLFFSAGILHQQYDSNKIQYMQNALGLQPLAAWGIIIGSIAVIGMPPFPVFFSKFFILMQLGGVSIPVLVLVLLLLLIAAGAMACLLIRTFSQQTQDHIPPYAVHGAMKLSIVILFIVIIGVSVYLSFGLNLMLNNIASSLGF